MVPRSELSTGRKGKPGRHSPAASFGLADNAAAEADGDCVGARTRLELREEMPDVRLDRLLGEEQPDADLAVHEAVGDQLEDLDLTRSRLLLELLQGAAERNDLGALPAAALRLCVETATVVHVSGQDLFALCSVHANRGIGLPIPPL